jgi:hypothetical protein
VEIGLVQVDTGERGKKHDHFTNLVLKHAKDVLKDALVSCAEHRGGKLSSWEDDSGTFIFPIEGPDSFNNCCLAALEMLEHLPAVKREVQLPADLEHLIAARIVCDTGTVACDPEVQNLPEEFVYQLKRHGEAVSADNKVTVTERVFRHLKTTLQSRFAKWKHSSELGIDLYSADAPAKSGPALALANLSSEETTEVEHEPTSENLVPDADNKGLSERKWRAGVTGALKSRTLLAGFGAGVLLAAAIFGLFRVLAPATKPQIAVAPPQQDTQPVLAEDWKNWKEPVQSEEWRKWRKQIHEKLSAAKLTEETLAEALRTNLPPRPEQAPAALRRDQAIADVLMAYPDVRNILKKRFGIYEDSYLGTGLSKPNDISDYGGATVHEYLIPNFGDDHPAVWMRILDPFNNPADMTTTKKTVKELFGNDLKPDDKKYQLVKAIEERVTKKDMVNPAMIRFARLDLSKYKYSRKLGRPDAYRVFLSNLAEVWNAPVEEAANLSGYQYADGEKVYIFVFLPNFPLPNKPGEVVLATWNSVLSNLPKWLSEGEKMDK